MQALCFLLQNNQKYNIMKTDMRGNLHVQSLKGFGALNSSIKSSVRDYGVVNYRRSFLFVYVICIYPKPYNGSGALSGCTKTAIMRFERLRESFSIT